MKSLILKTLSLAIVAAGTFTSTASQAKADVIIRESYDHPYCYREHISHYDGRCERSCYREPVYVTTPVYREHSYHEYGCSSGHYPVYSQYGCHSR
jgi:hypothetical protein